MVIPSAVLLLMAVSAVSAAEEAPPVEPDPVPGELEIVQKTAVALDARLPEGAEPTAVQWRIVEGEGGQLFAADREDAVFLAPEVDKGVKEFLLEVMVRYADQPMSTRQLRIRVFPEDPAAAEDPDGDGTPQWLTDHYRRAAEAEQQKQSLPPPAAAMGGGGPTVSIGVAGGSWGTHGGVGVRWGLSYPLTQPVDVPPPGQSHKAGEGAWAPARFVPYDELGTTLPPEVAEPYLSDDEASPADPEAEAESDADSSSD